YEVGDHDLWASWGLDPIAQALASYLAHPDAGGTPPPDAGPVPSAVPDGGFPDDRAIPLAPDPMTLGFDYVNPQACGAGWIARFAGAPSCQDAFDQDLMIMSALGVKRVRLVLVPTANGQTFQVSTCGGGVTNSDLADVESSLPVIVEALASHGMRAIVAF